MLRALPILILLACAGCTSSQAIPPKLAVARDNPPPLPTAMRSASLGDNLVPPRPITNIVVTWNVGGAVWPNGQPAAVPRFSGIESTHDFLHWFVETNIPVTNSSQPMQWETRPSSYGFFRAVDRY